MARRKVKNGEKSSSRRSLLFFVPYFSARLDFPSPPLSAPGSPRMRICLPLVATRNDIFLSQSRFSFSNFKNFSSIYFA